MKTLNLSIELSNIALESVGQSVAPDEWVDKMYDVLDRHTGLLGQPTGSQNYQKSLGNDLRLDEYQFDYERHSVQVEFVNFLPRGEWQVQGVRLV